MCYNKTTIKIYVRIQIDTHHAFFTIFVFIQGLKSPWLIVPNLFPINIYNSFHGLMIIESSNSCFRYIWVEELNPSFSPPDYINWEKGQQNTLVLQMIWASFNKLIYIRSRGDAQCTSQKEKSNKIISIKILYLNYNLNPEP